LASDQDAQQPDSSDRALQPTASIATASRSRVRWLSFFRAIALARLNRSRARVARNQPLIMRGNYPLIMRTRARAQPSCTKHTHMASNEQALLAMGLHDLAYWLSWHIYQASWESVIYAHTHMRTRSQRADAQQLARPARMFSHLVQFASVLGWAGSSARALFSKKRWWG
jgi:hypothetical protein